MNKQNEAYFQHKPNQLVCCKCATVDQKYVELDCQHVFCLMCVSFLYIKSRPFVQTQTQIQCGKCQCICSLDVFFIGLINQTLKEEVIPSLDPTDSFTAENKIIQTNDKKFHFSNTIGRKIKSEDHSFENVTPTTAKHFFSKGQSPISSNKNLQKKQCKYHPTNEIAYLCLTCQADMLCVKCISSSKKHCGHDIKDLPKSIQILKDNLNESKFTITYKIDQMQLIQKRINDKSLLVKEKALKTVQNIKFQFHELGRKLKEKQNQIIVACQEHFENLQNNFNREQEKLQYCIDLLSTQKEKLINVDREKDPLEFIYKYNQLQKINQKIANSEPEIPLEKLACPSNSIYKEISNLSEKILSLQIEYKQSHLGRMNIENCKSEEKIRKDKSYKRIRTNLGSLNSSRDKKDKKYTKTEEDEKRIRNEKIHYMNEKRNSAKIPAYINDFINKKGNKCGSGGSSYVLEMTNNQNSKRASKMSKTMMPEELKKKKEHTAVIKERIERKTVHPNFRTQKTCESKRKKKD